MRTISIVVFLVVGLAVAAWVDGSDGPPARAKGWVWEVQPVKGRLVVKVEERGAWFSRTFRIQRETPIVSYFNSDGSVLSEPISPRSIELDELKTGDEVVVIYRFRNGRYVASFVEKRR